MTGEIKNLLFSGVRIIYFDDSKLFLSVIGKMLIELGAEFLGVEDPSVAFEKILSFQPDLIITDLEMPQLDGIRLTQLIRADARFSSIPVVLLTAAENPEIAMKAIDSGADDFVAKAELSRILAPKIKALLRIRDNNLRILRLKELETVNTMVATYKHEFNNVLMILEGKLSIMQRHLPEGIELHGIEKIKGAIERMKEILKGLDAITEVRTEQYSGDTKILKLK